MLLIGAVLMLQSFLGLQRVNAGFNASRVITMELSLPESRYPEGPQWAAFYEQLVRRLQGLPGVQFAGATTQLPLSGDVGNTTFEIVGAPPAQPGEWKTTDWIAITPDYCRVMQIPLHAGRYFAEQDKHDSPPVCIINQSLAKRYLLTKAHLGKNWLWASIILPRRSWGLCKTCDNGAWMSIPCLLRSRRSSARKSMSPMPNSRFVRG